MRTDMPDKLDELLDKFFIMRAAGTDEELADIKRRNELGEPEIELKTAITELTLKQVLALIGEDQNECNKLKPCYCRIRNILRKELRQSAERIWK